MMSVETNGYHKDLTFQLLKAGGALALAATLMSSCSSSDHEPSHQTSVQAIASCDSLSVMRYGNKLEAYTGYTVANGVEYIGIHYELTISGVNQPAINVLVKQSPDGSLTYKLPPEPAVQHDELTAVIDYRISGKQGIYSTEPGPFCQVAIDYQP